MNKIKIEKYLEITDKEREESETIENPLTLKQLCYMQCAYGFICLEGRPNIK